ncbi:MAG: hypothetical protein MZW92_16170 [Comamonadaceae bacterium]|nr:hypothetical protein [Comamonadaceae bacterium]
MERAARCRLVAARARRSSFSTDFQLQVEHALDLVGRRARAVRRCQRSIAARPFEFATTPRPARDASFSSHDACRPRPCCKPSWM